MSWDVFVQDFPRDAKSVEDIPEDFHPSPIGKRSEIIAAILSIVPSTNFTNPVWGTIDGDGWSIEVNIGPGDPCESFAFHVRGGGAAIGIIAAILERLDLRAFAPQAGGFFTAGEESLACFEQWKMYRNQVVEGGSRKDNTQVTMTPNLAAARMPDMFSPKSLQPCNVVSTWIVLDKQGDASYFPQVGRKLSDDPSVQLVYWRCVVDFFAVLRKTNGEAYELRLYTNCSSELQEAPEEIRALLRELGVTAWQVSIDHYPPKSYTKSFRNQFYIFDILQSIAAEETSPRKYVVLDSDCICLLPLDALFEEVERKRVLSLDVGYTLDTDINGLTRRQMKEVYADFGLNVDEIPNYFGGEFFAATSDAIRQLAPLAEKTYRLCLERNEASLSKFPEEAHLLSFLYYSLGIDASGTANRFAKRLWTGVHYRNGIEADRQLAILHLPSEKRFGFAWLYSLVTNRKSWFYTLPYGDRWVANMRRLMSIPRPSSLRLARELLFYVRRKLGMTQ